MKASKPINEQLPPAILYREDIEEIYGILDDLADNVSIDADGHIFENIDELFSHKRIIINDLHMGTSFPYFSTDITFRPNDITFLAEDDANEQVGAYHKIKSIVEKRRNWSHWILNKPYLKAVLIISIFPLIALYSLTKTFFYLKAALFIIIVAFILAIYSLFIGSKKYSQIVLAYKKDKPLSFFKQYQDSIVIPFIIGLIFFILERIIPS